MKCSAIVLLIACGTAASTLIATPAMAHHSYAMFDRNKVIAITGTVKKIARVSPHGTIWLYVPNEKGDQEIWAVQLTAAGIGKSKDDSIKEGDKLTLEINPLRDGRNGGSLVRVHLADGRVLTDGSEDGSRSLP